MEDVGRDQDREHDIAPSRGTKKTANRDSEDVRGEPDDYEHRRKLQNRLAQRRYRKKLRQRLEKQLSEEPTTAEEQQPEEKATSKNVKPVSPSDVVPAYSCYEFDAGVPFDSAPLLTSRSLSDNQNVWGFPEGLGGSPGVSGADHAFPALTTADYGLWHTMNHLVGDRLTSAASLPHSALHQSTVLQLSSPSDDNEPRSRRSLTAGPNSHHLQAGSTSGRKMEVHQMARAGSADGRRKETSTAEELRTGYSRRKKRGSLSILPRKASCSCHPNPREQPQQAHQQYSNSGRRAQSVSGGSTREASSASSYRRKLNKRASEMIAELGQLYKVGVSLEMLRYDSRFITDLVTMRERFVQLSESCHSSPGSERDSNLSGDSAGILDNRPDCDSAVDKLDFDNFNLLFPLTAESSSGTDIEKEPRSRSRERSRDTTRDYSHGSRSYVDSRTR